MSMSCGIQHTDIQTGTHTLKPCSHAEQTKWMNFWHSHDTIANANLWWDREIDRTEQIIHKDYTEKKKKKQQRKTEQTDRKKNKLNSKLLGILLCFPIVFFFIWRLVHNLTRNCNFRGSLIHIVYVI